MGKVLMVQGTMSNAGKSILTAGICRALTNRGYKVAPFKSQNMALNSYITDEGLEIGRAQVVQAEACKVTPSVLMNPILLKPTSDIGSQIIVNGKSIGVMTAREYFKRKKEFIPLIKDSFNKLLSQNDYVIIEGAGSPAEINLKSEDIVNMGMAKMAKAPVLLVGDIDRGGVFAQLVGTLALLEPEEREMIKGLVINKFRGDKSLLDSGIDYLRNREHIENIEVMPYINVDIDDEDSLSSRLQNKGKVGLIDVAVIRLPRISNFTDFSPFENIEEVNFRYVDNPRELKHPDLIIIPGTKNTIGDMKWLRESGFEVLIKKAYNNGSFIIGVCGGYQILGDEILDPYKVEEGGSIKGLGFLPIKTTFNNEKCTAQAEGVIAIRDGIYKTLNNIRIKGYEIHNGQTKVEGKTIFSNVNNKTDGCINEKVLGTYLHGIFDNTEFLNELLKIIIKDKGLSNEVRAIDYWEYKNKNYDILAKAIEENINVKKIIEIMERGL